MSPPRVQGYWEDHARDFDALYGEGSATHRAFNRVFRPALEERLALTVRECLARPGAQVLDVGCGSGRGAVPLAKAGCTVTGIDFSQPMLDLARDLARREGVEDRCAFVVGDFEQAKFPRRFDAVVALGVLDYVTAPAPFLRRMGVLSKGKVIASAPTPSPVRAPLRRWRYAREGCPVFFYTVPAMEQLAREAGFDRFRLEPLTGGHLLVAEVG